LSSFCAKVPPSLAAALGVDRAALIVGGGSPPQL
jgi:hypothetical protein